jgi:hypothetical protein
MRLKSTRMFFTSQQIFRHQRLLWPQINVCPSNFILLINRVFPNLRTIALISNYMSNVDSSKRLLTNQCRFFINWSTLRLLNHNFNITWSWFTRLWGINIYIFFSKKRINSSYFAHDST